MNNDAIAPKQSIGALIDQSTLMAQKAANMIGGTYTQGSYDSTGKLTGGFTPDVPSNITSNNLDSSQKPINLPSFNDNSQQYAGVGASAESKITSQNIQNQIDEYKNNAQKNVDTNKSWMEKYLGLKTGAQQEALNAYQSPETQKQKQAKVDAENKLNSIKQSELAESQAINDSGMLPNAKAIELRNVGYKYAVMKAGASVELDAATNNYNSTIETINNVASMKSAMYDPYINYYSDLLKNDQGVFNDAEKTILNKYLEDYKQQQTDARDNAKANGEAIAKYNSLGAGITFNDTPEQRAQKIASVGGDLQYERSLQAIKNASSGSGDFSGIVSPVAQLTDGTYDTATQNAILAQMTPQDAALVKAVGEYRADISKVTSLRSDARQKLMAQVALVYPNFDMKNYATIASYKKGLAGTAQGTTGGAINSANKVINHLTEYVDNVSGLSKSPVGGFVGRWINAGQNELTSVGSQKTQESLAAASTAATGVKDELAKFFKGSGVADVTSISDWGKTVNVNNSPAAQRGSVQAAIDLLQGQLVPMMDQYKQTTFQEPPEGLFLKTDTIQKLSKLKNEGFKIDIPGVYYTDKTAWQNYGGGTKADWDAAITKLQNAGLPLTQDNILQAAQLQ